MLELVPPGRVIFLRPLKAAGARAGFDAVWVRPEEILREVRPPSAGFLPSAGNALIHVSPPMHARCAAVPPSSTVYGSLSRACTWGDGRGRPARCVTACIEEHCMRLSLGGMAASAVACMHAQGMLVLPKILQTARAQVLRVRMRAQGILVSPKMVQWLM